MAFVAVEDRSGTQSIGSAVHMGEGVFVTARHVIDGHKVLEVARTERTHVPLAGEVARNCREFLHVDGKEIPIHTVSNGPLRIQSGPYFHKDPSVDVAVFKVADVDELTPFVQLGGHLDDWLGESDFVLDEVILLGYPPIPLARKPHLVAARAEVNAVVDLHDNRHAHFIVSAMPRGGFSGGIAIAENGYGLGIVTRSLLPDGKESELGFLAVLSVEPLYVCMGDWKLLPDCQASGWDDLFTAKPIEFFSRERTDKVRFEIGGIEVVDDGKRFHIQVRCEVGANLLEQALESAERALQVQSATSRELIRVGMVKVRALSYPTSETMKSAVNAAVDVFLRAGYVRG